MGIIIGIDVGGSTTKIVGFDGDKRLIAPMTVRATDPITSIYGAFGKFTAANCLPLTDIKKVAVTGAGSSYIAEPIYGLPCETVPEFASVGRGGLYLSCIEEAIVVSMGTGTAFIHAVRGGEIKPLGGTGVGGGTMMGLAKKLLDMDDVSNILKLAEQGDLDRVDLRVRDITPHKIMSGMPDDFTASNFGKLSDLATREDLALGILNMILETIGMLSVFAAQAAGLTDVVLTGNMSVIPSAGRVFGTLSALFGLNFIIPDKAEYSTAIGAALSVS